MPEGTLSSDGWVYDPPAEPKKILVEGKCSGNAEPDHDSKAAAVHETETLIAILLKDRPSLAFAFRVQANQRHDGLIQQSTPKLHSRFMSQAHSNQSESLKDNEIGGDEKILVSFNKPQRSVVKPIRSICQCVEG